MGRVRNSEPPRLEPLRVERRHLAARSASRGRACRAWSARPARRRRCPCRRRRYTALMPWSAFAARTACGQFLAGDLRVVDHRIGAQITGLGRLLLRRGGGDDAGATRLSPSGRAAVHTTGRRMDEYRVARLHRGRSRKPGIARSCPGAWPRRPARASTPSGTAAAAAVSTTDIVGVAACVHRPGQHRARPRRPRRPGRAPPPSRRPRVPSTNGCRPGRRPAARTRP